MKKEAHKLYYKNTGVSKEIELLGEKFTFVVFKNPKEDEKEALIYFLSSLKNKKKISAIYPIRWKIECCFKHLKSNGFNLEAINFKNSDKIKFMMTIVSFLYALCVYQGLLIYKKSNKNEFKNYQNGRSYLTISIFKKGEESLETKFNNLASFIRFLIKILKGKEPPPRFGFMYSSLHIK